MLNKVLLGCGAISSALYVISDVIAARRYDGYSYADQWFSELTAEGAPTRPLMIVINGIPYTALMTAFAVGIWKSAGQNRAQRLTAALLGGYAAAGIAGGVGFPMATRDAEASPRNVMHIPATMVMSLCVLLAMGTGSRLLGNRFRSYSYGTIAAVIAFGVLTSTQAGKIAENEPTPWAGIEERVNIYATMLWLAVLSIGLLRMLRSIDSRTVEKPTITVRAADARPATVSNWPGIASGFDSASYHHVTAEPTQTEGSRFAHRLASARSARIVSVRSGRYGATYATRARGPGRQPAHDRRDRRHSGWRRDLD